MDFHSLPFFPYPRFEDLCHGASRGVAPYFTLDGAHCPGWEAETPDEASEALAAACSDRAVSSALRTASRCTGSTPASVQEVFPIPHAYVLWRHVRDASSSISKPHLSAVGKALEHLGAIMAAAAARCNTSAHSANQQQDIVCSGSAAVVDLDAWQHYQQCAKVACFFAGHVLLLVGGQIGELRGVASGAGGAWGTASTATVCLGLTLCDKRVPRIHAPCASLAPAARCKWQDRRRPCWQW